MTPIIKKDYDSSECIWIEEKNEDGTANENFKICTTDAKYHGIGR